MRRVNLIETLQQDLRYAVRSFGKSPGFTALAIGTLTLGMGASLAILTVVNSVLIRPLPFPGADRLVVLFATSSNRGVYQDSTSFPDFQAWKTQSRAFAGMAAYRRDPFSVTGGGAPERVTGVQASYELFQVLGVSPAMGRAFDEQEQHGKSAVVIISHGLWMRRFGGDPNILGKTILIDEVSHSVIGVLPQGFQFPSFTDTDVIVPIPENANRSTGYLLAIARLMPGARIAAARRDLDAVSKRLEQAFPYTNRGRGVNVLPLQWVAVGDARTPLLMLMGASVFVLLTGCANAGNLTLARGIARGRELAVRSALGAGGVRIVRQVLTESAALALTAAVLGAALAFWGSKLLVTALAQSFALPKVTFDWTLLALAALIALVSGVICSSRVACLTDPADNAQLSSVAPGQLISLYGADLAPAAPYTPAGGVAQSSNTFGVFFNGIPAPILYSSGQQINVQVPYEIAGASTVQMQVVSQQIESPVSETRALGVVERQPAIFLSQAALASPFPGWSACGGVTALGQAALALNADGTVNDCANPAIAGSAVTVFLGGFGPVTPALGTGVIASGPAAALAPSLSAGPFTGTTVIATASLPGSITGVAQVRLQAGGGGGGNVLLNGPTLAGASLRERVILIWTR